MANRKRKCRFCEKRKPADTMIIVPLGALCDENCLKGYWEANKEKAIEKNKARKLKEYRAETRAMRRAMNEKDHKWQVKETQKVFNELIRLLDRDQPCIVHGRHQCGNDSGWDAGHYLTRAAYPMLRFDARNCFKQCGSSNSGTEIYGGGQASIREKFEFGIVTRFGAGHLMWLKGLHPAAHWSCEDLAEMRAAFRAEIRHIKDTGKPSRNWRALPEEFRMSA